MAEECEFKIALRAIAQGRWNVGNAGRLLTMQQYAKKVLGDKRYKAP